MDIKDIPSEIINKLLADELERMCIQYSLILEVKGQGKFQLIPESDIQERISQLRGLTPRLVSNYGGNNE
jgi:hypothetical protein